MNRSALNGASKDRSLLTFFLLVVLFSIPFWALDPLAERFLPKDLPVDLPLSSLMALAPATVAAVLVRKKEGSAGVKKLLKRAFDYKRIRGKIWFVPILFFHPSAVILQYGLMRLMGLPLPAPQLPILMLPVSFLVFLIAALGEEVGWQGYAIDPLQRRWNALTAGAILGIVGAAWHIVPLIQLGRTPTWMAWQCMCIFVVRILTVWIYNNTGKSVFAAILFHAMYNVSTVLLPSYGWPYDPFVALIITAVALAIITLLWGHRTLALQRFAQPGQSAQLSAGR